MFDSDNISIVTRIEAGTGVSVTYVKNSAGESVWKAALDQTWLQTYVDARFTALDTAALARITALETVTGITTPTTVTPPTSTTGISTITFGGTVGTSVTLTWNILGLDGKSIVTRKYTQALPSGATAEHVARTVDASIKAAAPSDYITSTSVSGSVLTINWAVSGFTISATATGGVTLTIVN